MYRVALEAIVGFTKRGDRFRMEPRVPAAWPELRLEYRHGGTTYEVVVEQPHRATGGRQQVELDGHASDGEWVHLVDDGRRHAVVIRPRD